MPMGLDTVIPNAVIESDWGNEVADRVVGRFATTAERDAAILSPVSGMTCYVATAGLMVRHSGAWVVVSPLARRGVTVSSTGQAVATGATAAVSWTSEIEDTSGYYPGSGTTITIPATVGAATHAMSALIHTSAPVDAPSDVQIYVSGVLWAIGYIPATKSDIAVSVTSPVTAGNTVIVNVYNGHSSSLFYSGSFRAYATH